MVVTGSSAYSQRISSWWSICSSLHDVHPVCGTGAGCSLTTGGKSRHKAVGNCVLKTPRWALPGLPEAGGWIGMGSLSVGHTEAASTRKRNRYRPKLGRGS
jgi:hypothetical protein